MTFEERKASLDAMATERAATLNPPVHHVTTADLHKRVAELEGKPFAGDPANDFHQKGNALEDQHGKARAKFIQKLTQGNIVEETFMPLFLKLLNEYEVDGSGEPPYDVAKLAEDGEALNKPLYTEGWDTGFAGENDPYGISEYTGQSANADAHSDGVLKQGAFEDAAYRSAGVDVRPSEEKANG